MLLINNKLWIKENVCDKLFKNTSLLNAQNNLIWPDQDVLNYTFEDNVFFAKPEYNFQYTGFYKPCISLYSKKDFQKAKKNIVFLHYNSPLKPWNAHKQNESYEEYWDYLKLTDFWSNEQKQKYKNFKKNYFLLKIFSFEIFTIYKIRKSYEMLFFGIKTKI